MNLPDLSFSNTAAGGPSQAAGGSTGDFSVGGGAVPRTGPAAWIWPVVLVGAVTLLALFLWRKK
jgi:hypothetical protein